MSNNGVDALILLMNDSVVYATGTSSPCSIPGLSHVERPVALSWPPTSTHVFLPFRKGPRRNHSSQAAHRHGPLYSNCKRGRRAARTVDQQAVVPHQRASRSTR